MSNPACLGDQLDRMSMYMNRVEESHLKGSRWLTYETYGVSETVHYLFILHEYKYMLYIICINTYYMRTLVT